MRTPPQNARATIAIFIMTPGEVARSNINKPKLDDKTFTRHVHHGLLIVRQVSLTLIAAFSRAFSL